MAMNFTPAGRAAMPDYTNAYLEQEKIRNQIRQAEQMRRMGYFGAGASAAEKVPYSKWADFGKAVTGHGSAAAESALVDPLTGAVASAAPGASASSLPSALASAEAASAADAAIGAQGAMAAEGAGIGPALSALGPMGWLALLGFGLAATDAFN